MKLCSAVGLDELHIRKCPSILPLENGRLWHNSVSIRKFVHLLESGLTCSLYQPCGMPASQLRGSPLVLTLFLQQHPYFVHFIMFFPSCNYDGFAVRVKHTYNYTYYNNNYYSY